MRRHFPFIGSMTFLRVKLRSQQNSVLPIMASVVLACGDATPTKGGQFPTTITLEPSSIVVPANGGYQMSTVITDENGVPLSMAVDFSATGGTVSSEGMYRASSELGTFRVIAKVSGFNLADTSEVTITSGPTASSFMPNLPDGMIPLLDEDFSSADDIYPGNYGSSAGFDDPTAPYSPPHVARFVYPAGDADGFFTGNASYTAPVGTKRVYIAYNWRLSNPFTLHPANLKGWYFYRQTGQLSGSLVVGWRPTSADLNSGSFQLNGQPQTVAGPGRVDPDATVPSLQRGRWTHTEILAVMNSNQDTSDGILRVWVDNVLIIDNTAMRYSEGGQALEWRGVHLDPYYGGNTPGHVITDDSYLYIDHAVVLTSAVR